MSDFRFGLDDYGLNYFPIDATDGLGGVEWDEVERVEIEDFDFVRRRTCECDGTISWAWNGWTKFYEHELSCGHVITSTEKEPPKFCEECGAEVVGR